MSNSPILELKDISYYIHPDRVILENLFFSIYPGDSVAVVGRNGSGKSTLGKIIAGLVDPKRGERLLTTDRANLESENSCRNATIGMVFQNPDNQLVGSIVEEDIRYGMENYGIPKEEQDARLTDVVTLLGIESLLPKFTAALSGGQKQIVAIAGTLVLRPKIIVFDEITSMVDPWMKGRLLDIIKNLKEQFTLITISHDPDVVAQMDRVIVLEGGNIAGDMSPVELYYDKAEQFSLVVPSVVQITKKWLQRGYTVPRGFCSEALAEALCRLL